MDRYIVHTGIDYNKLFNAVWTGILYNYTKVLIHS